MRDLSISKAWDESKGIIARDGRLFMSVSLALVALPAAVTGLLRPNGVAETSTALWIDIVLIIGSLVALAGQLALIRLALGPSITVGGAIAHGMRRMPVYLVSAILIMIALLILAIPFAAVLMAMGVPLDMRPIPLTPAVTIVGCLYLALACFVAIRMMMGAPSASAESIGPVAILKRSWELTSGHWWQLFGFILLFFIGALALLLGVAAAAGVVVALLLGPIEPMSASALVVALGQAIVNAAVTTLLAVMLARIYIQLAGRSTASVPTSGT